MTEQIKVPKRYQRIDKQVKSWDKTYFKAHPSAKFYFRQRLKGEFYPVEPIIEEVCVFNFSKGIRVRLSIYARGDENCFLIRLDTEPGHAQGGELVEKMFRQFLMEQSIQMVQTELIPEVD